MGISGLFAGESPQTMELSIDIIFDLAVAEKAFLVGGQLCIHRRGSSQPQ
jgi:hypothetical protein